MITNKKSLLFLAFLFGSFFAVSAQEMVIPLQSNPYQQKNIGAFQQKKKRATLPFVDDFSYNSSTPNPNLWEEEQVFINNTFGVGVPTMGVATFDGLNEQGRPYRPNDFTAVGYGDSLTCTPIDFSFRNPADSIVLSFYLQPQGNGFAPELNDSFYVFFRDVNNNWVQVFERFGSGYKPFEQFFVSVNNPQYFHDSFQFRFVSFTSLNLNDDIWNLDYVELDVNRGHIPFATNDIAFSTPPTSILDKYTAMPFRHFVPSDLSSSQEIGLRNLYTVANAVTVKHSSQEINTSATLSNNTLAPITIPPYISDTVSNSSYSLGLGGNGPFVVRNTYFFDPLNGTDRKSNDTIISEVVFDNYFAYDDGTPELAYFLNAAQNQPAKTAIRFELKQADSVYGLSVFFAAQVPSAAGKLFSIILYDSLGNTSSGDVILHQQDFYTVQYPSQRGEFSSYAFDQPVGLGAGTYYIGLQQPANSGADSIYYGLDVNNDNNIDVLSYNVNGFWYNSSVQGTVMMRPMVGGRFTPTNITVLDKETETVLYPNPASDNIHIKSDVSWQTYEIYNLSGQMLRSQKIIQYKIDLSSLAPGQYGLKLLNNYKTATHKIWKR